MTTKRRSIGMKLGLAFASTTALTLAIGLAGWTQMRSIQAGAEDLGTNWLPSVQAIGNVRIAANRVRRTESELFLPESDDARAGRTAQLQERMAQMLKAEEAYAPLVTPGEESRRFDAYKVQRQKYAELQKAMLALPATERAQLSKRFFGESEQAFDAMANELGRLADFNRTSGDGAVAMVRSTYGRAVATLLALVVAAIAIASVLAVWITRMITRPVREAVLVAEGVAAGDLTMAIEPRGRDEIALLMQALATMRASLLQVVGGVRANAESVATASAQIAQGNHDLSSRTEQQASALEETAASMEELSSTVKQNADNARQANQLSMNASTVAVQGGQVVGEVVETMKGINESSNRISDIIGTIDGIAFQTNILALNAAVEAARAGDQGRGFAVVASEVRSLAQRSAEAAKQVKVLITASVERVEHGTALVGKAGSTMTEVVAAIQRVTDIMGEISAASSEQATGVAQVGEAVVQMDQATQQNAALVEEGAAAAASLRQQAEELVAAMSVFKLDASPTAGMPVAARLQHAPAAALPRRGGMLPVAYPA
ncbi:methyl-accepting chemotaxis protein [Xylophilus sp. Leaf220]|uniref:methyl-accepting chemotaxis protein n=1 Tax=Xylophilus sp. Leaf220 TaxID=1735686 RepID=UPI0009E7C5E6|nr:methyl-accepting chemotaxis protein [Xylophilus sp. Leaf220]